MNWYRSASLSTALVLLVILLFAQAAVLATMGQPLTCDCGYVKLWHGETYSSENSQHLTDWYTFSHIIHGFILYGIIWIISRGRWPMWVALPIALIPEFIWEIVENTPWVINRYREATIALDYYGDSIVNSVSDTLAAAFGFLLAARLPVWVVVLLAIAMEVVVGYLIHDNFTLNVTMLLFPLESIKEWQMGG